MKNFLCLLFGHKSNFVRGERREGILGADELCEEYECLGCGKQWAWISGTGSILLAASAAPKGNHVDKE